MAWTILGAYFFSMYKMTCTANAFGTILFQKIQQFVLISLEQLVYITGGVLLHSSNKYTPLNIYEYLYVSYLGFF